MSTGRHELLLITDEGAELVPAAEVSFSGEESVAFEGGLVPAAEVSFSGTEAAHPAEYGIVPGAEAWFNGLVSPEIAACPQLDAWFQGTEDISGPAPTSRLVRKRATPVTWEH